MPASQEAFAAYIKATDKLTTELAAAARSLEIFSGAALAESMRPVAVLPRTVEQAPPRRAMALSGPVPGEK